MRRLSPGPTVRIEAETLVAVSPLLAALILSRTAVRLSAASTVTDAPLMVKDPLWPSAAAVSATALPPIFSACASEMTSMA
jgi:hypothetical protein